MSEQKNTALVHSIFESFGRGDIPGMVSCFAGDAEIDYPGPAVIPYAGKIKGREEISRYFESILTNQTDHELSIEQFVTEGDMVVAIGHYRGVMKATGKQVETPLVFTFQIEDGVVKRHLLMSDTAASQEAYTAAAAAAS